MKVGYFTGFRSLTRSTLGSKNRSRRLFPILGDNPLNDAVRLRIPASTEADLEIFESKSEGKSLFEFCDKTQTFGGKQKLVWRLKNPYSEPRRILQTQLAVASINDNREVFNKIRFFLMSRLERYQKDPIRFVTHKNWFEFTLGAIALKLFDGHQYRQIYRGVEYTALFVEGLREFLALVEISELRGEIVPFCDRIRSILEGTKISELPGSSLRSLSSFRILRFDQAFRIYEKDVFLELLEMVYQIDSLLSLADTTRSNEFCLPTLLGGPTQVKGTGIFHPHIDDAVPNDFEINQQSRLLFLTGPNMAGKTTYLRSVAVALYFAQVGMGVPAKRFNFTPVEHLFCSISVADDIHSGTSYFHAEVNNVHEIALAIDAGAKVVAIMDEPFKGTNVKDALEASFAVLSRLQTKTNCLFLVSSHLIELDELFDEQSRIKRCYFEARESEETLQFDYRLQDGVSDQRLGMRVLNERKVIELLDKPSVLHGADPLGDSDLILDLNGG